MTTKSSISQHPLLISRSSRNTSFYDYSKV